MKIRIVKYENAVGWYEVQKKVWFFWVVIDLVQGIEKADEMAKWLSSEFVIHEFERKE